MPVCLWHYCANATSYSSPSPFLSYFFMIVIIFDNNNFMFSLTSKVFSVWLTSALWSSSSLTICSCPSSQAIRSGVRYIIIIIIMFPQAGAARD